MQVYFPSFKTKQGAIAMFDYLMASRDSDDSNVIFNSDLNLEDLSHLPGGTGPIEKYNSLNTKEFYSFLGFIIEHFEDHNGQLFQDLFVLWKLKEKNHGVFVEIGTGYPTSHNNTWLLESKLNWTGVLVEPNPVFHTRISQARKTPLETNAIHYHSNTPLTLVIPNNIGTSGGISDQYETTVGYIVTHKDTVKVNSISLIECFEKYHIPKEFDYLSYDTTGNIADIRNIESIFTKNYMPKIITIGHNYKTHRHDVNDMLKSYGYIRMFDYVSRWDDWYCHKSLEENQ